MKNFVYALCIAVLGAISTVSAMVPSYKPMPSRNGASMFTLSPAGFNAADADMSVKKRVVAMPSVSYDPSTGQLFDNFNRAWILAPGEETSFEKLASKAKYAAAATVGLSLGSQYRIACEHGLKGLYKHEDSWPMFFWNPLCGAASFVKESAKSLGAATKESAKKIALSAQEGLKRNAVAAKNGMVNTTVSVYGCAKNNAKRMALSAQEGLKRNALAAKNGIVNTTVSVYGAAKDNAKRMALSTQEGLKRSAVAAKNGIVHASSEAYGCTKHFCADHRRACLIAGGVVAAVAVAYAAKRAYALLPATEEEQLVDHSAELVSLEELVDSPVTSNVLPVV